MPPLFPPHQGFRIDKNGNIMHFFEPPVIENLVLEGGGPRAVVYEGALDVLYQAKVLDHLKRIGASSAGAIPGVMLAMGFKPNDIKYISDQVHLSTLQDLSPRMLTTAVDKMIQAGKNLISEGQGLFEGNVLLGVARVLIKDRVQETVDHILGTLPGEQKDAVLAEMMAMNLIDLRGQDVILQEPITFKHFHYLATKFPESGFKDLFLTGTNYTRKRLEIFSHDTEPDMEVAFAIRITMSIPWVYKMPVYRGCHYMDGGALKNFPMGIFDDPRYLPAKKTLGESGQNMATLGLKVDDQREMREVLWQRPRLGMIGRVFAAIGKKIIRPFVNRFIGVKMQKAALKNANETYEKYSQRTVQIDDKGYSLTYFDLKENDKKILRTSGHESATGWVNAHTGEMLFKKYRNFSDMPLKIIEEFSVFLHGSKAADIIVDPTKSAREIEQVYHTLVKKVDERLREFRPQDTVQAKKPAINAPDFAQDKRRIQFSRHEVSQGDDSEREGRSEGYRRK